MAMQLAPQPFMATAQSDSDNMDIDIDMDVDVDVDVEHLDGEEFLEVWFIQSHYRSYILT